jgi:ParB/RepB/Spo0J family partition protein
MKSLPAINGAPPAPPLTDVCLRVPTSSITEDPANERKTFRDMDGLVASIKKVGIIEPITVCHQGNKGGVYLGSYQILTGHRRFRAAIMAGLTEIEVVVRERKHDRARRRQSIVSNIQREDVGPVEMAEALQALMDEDPEIDSQQDLADMIGKDKAWVSGKLGILRMPPKLLEKVRASQLSISSDSVEKIARVERVESQEALVQLLLSGANSKVIREQIKAHNIGKDVGGKEVDSLETAVDWAVQKRAVANEAARRESINKAFRLQNPPSEPQKPEPASMAASVKITPAQRQRIRDAARERWKKLKRQAKITAGIMADRKAKEMEAAQRKPSPTELKVRADMEKRFAGAKTREVCAHCGQAMPHAKARS